MTKQFSIQDFLTEAQINQAAKIYKDTPSGRQATEICERVIKPNLAEINRKLGQENDPKYLAYVVEYVFSQTLR